VSRKRNKLLKRLENISGKTNKKYKAQENPWGKILN